MSSATVRRGPRVPSPMAGSVPASVDLKTAPVRTYTRKTSSAVVPAPEVKDPPSLKVSSVEAVTGSESKVRKPYQRRKADPAPEPAADVPVALPKTKAGRKPKTESDGTKPSTRVQKLDQDGHPVARTVRSTQPLLSPRTVHSQLVSTPSGDRSPGLSYRQLRQSSDVLSRHIIRLINGALQISKSKKAVTVSNKEMTGVEIREAARVVAKSVRRLPVKTRTVTKKGKEAPLSPEERERRVTVLKERVTAGVTTLMANVRNSKIDTAKVRQILIRNEHARLDADPMPPKADVGSQISAAMYMSDQFVEFVLNANFGNGLTFLYPGYEFSEECQAECNPEKALSEVSRVLGRDPSEELGGRESALALVDPRHIISPLVLRERIARPPLLMSLMSKYVTANRLKADNVRVRLNSVLRKFFGEGTTTKWTLNGEVIPPPPGKESDDYALSGLARLAKRPSKVEGGPVPFDGETLQRPMLIALASMYRIPKVSPEREAKLQSAYIKDLTVGLKAYL